MATKDLQSITGELWKTGPGGAVRKYLSTAWGDKEIFLPFFGSKQKKPVKMIINVLLTTTHFKITTTKLTTPFFL